MSMPWLRRLKFSSSGTEMSRGKYRDTEVTLADGEFAEPNVDEHGTLIITLSDASVTALAAAIVAAIGP